MTFTEEFPQTVNKKTTLFGNAERMKANYPDTLLYDAANRKWYIWNHRLGCWRMDRQKRVEALTKEVLRQVVVEAELAREDADKIEDADKRESAVKFAKELSKFAAACQTPYMVNATLETYQSDVAVIPKMFDVDDYLLNFNNGTLNLKTYAFQPHNRGDLITKSTRGDYNESAECPKFLAYLDRIFKSQPEKAAVIEYVQMMCGYCLTGNTDKQVIFLAYGGGKNGKSVLLSTISGVLGEYGTSADGKILVKEKNGGVGDDIAALVGARFVRISEVPANSTLDEQRVKNLAGSGMEPISVRKLYGEYFEFQPKCKIVLAVNHLPNARDMSYGMWRRLRAIPFEETISDEEQRDFTELVNDLLTEAPGIINWMVRGLKKLTNGGSFDKCETVNKFTAEYKIDADVYSPFLAECCERCEQSVLTTEMIPKDFTVKAGDLYDVYLGWTENNGYTRPKSLQAFGRDMKERLGHKNVKHTETGNEYHGIKLKVGMMNIYQNPAKRRAIERENYVRKG